ncbi:MAG: LysM peptidoglycan-binding domain-containing protein [Gammaproteobacteria bacterium]
MPSLPLPVRFTDTLLRRAVRQLACGPALTGSLLLVLAPATQALTLGEISVRSTLGQPLNATVPVRLASGETLAAACVTPGMQSSDLRPVPGASVSTPQATREGGYELRVTSAAALYEPMYELEIRVQCPGAPMLVRQYVLMLDLPGAVATGAATPAVAPTALPANLAPAPVAVSAGPATGSSRQLAAPRTRAASRSPVGSTIEAGTRYRVATGDTLSAIALRVRGRSGSWQAMADAIQAANPDAFIRNDANLIKLGSEIVIPASATTDAGVTASAAVAAAPMAPEPAPAPVLETPAETPVTAVADAAAPVVAIVTETAAPVVASPAAPVRPAARPAAPVANAGGTEDAEVPTSSEPNPVVAAGAGILFGLLVSTLLWFRGRLPARKRTDARPAPERQAPDMLATVAVASPPVPLVTRPTEPSFSVSYTPAQEDALAAEFADETVAANYTPAPVAAQQPLPEVSEDITNELEELFESTDTTIQKRLHAEKTVATRSLPGGSRDAAEDDPMERTGTVDLHALAAAASADQQQAQTLLEALTLLERDYEEELTASQVLDMSAVRKALGNDLDEPTQVSATPAREASARKRSR